MSEYARMVFYRPAGSGRRLEFLYQVLDSGKYVFPGGKIEKRETPHRCNSKRTL